MAFEDDERLVARMLRGEAGAVEDFIDRHRPFIYAIFTRYLKLRSDEADEVFQRFLVRVWEDDYRRLREWSRSTKLAIYLARIARNLAHDYRRESGPTLANPPDRPVDDMALDNVETRERIALALARLLPRDRELIDRRYLQEQTYEDIAAALGISVNNVGVALARAKRRLKQVLSKEI
jgi:RNA polymerase sigma-70 factor (ECF subfamily)